jgi:hypothetical protein
MWQHDDADAERLQLRHAFEHARGHADLMQAERQRQPANSAACDQYRHDMPSLVADGLAWRCRGGQPRKERAGWTGPGRPR